MRVFERRTVITAAALIILGLARAQEPVTPGTQAQPAAPVAAEAQPTAPATPLGTEQSPVVVRVLPSAQTPVDPAKEAQEQKERLELNRRLVEFNGDLALYTKVLAGIAGLQVLILGTLIVVVRLAIKGATGAGSVARDAIIAAERAFVFPLGVTGSWELNPTTRLYDWRFRPTWRNSGDTPTRQMTMHTECVVRSTPLPAGFDFNYPTMQTATALVPPDAEIPGGIAPLAPTLAVSAQDLADAQNDQKFIYLWGWARYLDVFPGTAQHITRFCWLLTPLGDPLAFMPDHPNGVTFRPVHHFEGNCTDDECPA